MLQGLRAAVASQDAPSVAREAHRFKGSIGNVAQGPLPRLAAAIEGAATAGALEAVPGQLGALEQEYAAFAEALRGFVLRGGSDR